MFITSSPSLIVVDCNGGASISNSPALLFSPSLMITGSVTKPFYTTRAVLMTVLAATNERTDWLALLSLPM